MSADTEQKKDPSAISEAEADALSEKFTASWESDDEPVPEANSAAAAPAPKDVAPAPGAFPKKKTMLGLAPYSGAGPEPGAPAQQPGSSSPFDAAAAALAATHPFPTGESAQPEKPTPDKIESPSPEAKAEAAPAEPTKPPEAEKPVIPRQRTLVGIQAPDDDELEKLAESFADAPDPVTKRPAAAEQPKPVAETATVAKVSPAESPAPSPAYAPPSTPPSSAGSQEHKTQGSVVVEQAEQPDQSAQERVLRQADTLPPARPDAIAIDVPPEWGSQGSKKKAFVLGAVALALLGTVGLLTVLGGDEKEKTEPPAESAATATATATATAAPTPSEAPASTEAAEEESSEATEDASAPAEEEEEEEATEAAEEEPPKPKPAPKRAVAAPKPKAKAKPAPVRTTKPKPKAKKPAKKKTTTKKPAIVRDAPF